MLDVPSPSGGLTDAAIGGTARSEPTLDAAARAAAAIVGADLAVLSVSVDGYEAFFGHHARDPLAPVLDEVTQRVVHRVAAGSLARGQGSIVDRVDAALGDQAVGARLAVPVRGREAGIRGVLCVATEQPRTWSQQDWDALEDIALLVEHVFLARTTANGLLTHLEHQHEQVRALVHDIRQPLSAASGAAQLLEVATDEGELVDLVATGVDRADRLLSQLATARDDASILVSLAEAVRRACCSSGVVGAGRLTVDVDPDAAVLGQALDVERIVSNLVRNAFVHGGEGVHVRVRGWRSFDGVVLEVEDDGVGIRAEDLDRIWDLGGRVDTGAPGQGIGLHVVRSLVRRTGGDVEIRTRPGQGTLFHLRLHDVADAKTIDLTAG